MTGQLTAAFIPGADGITFAGRADDGAPILLELPAAEVVALCRQAEAALGDMVRHRARQPAPHHTTDEPLPDRVGVEGE